MALQEAMFEAHHLVPLAETGERKTRLADLALLCACCHRLIHRAMVAKADWIGLVEARALLVSTSQQHNNKTGEAVGETN
ncbi:HNH endonuclease [compost metagenome]